MATPNDTPASKAIGLNELADLLALIDHAAGNGFDGHPDSDARVRRARALLRSQAGAALAHERPAPLQRLQFPGQAVYALDPTATEVDLSEYLNARLKQLSAMLHMTCATAAESFNLYNEETRHDFLWGCLTMADECRELFKLMHEGSLPGRPSTETH